MKKRLKVLCIICGIIFILAMAFFVVDYNQVKKQNMPIFCIKKTTGTNGETDEYIGLGYKVIHFNTSAGFDKIKIGTWFMNYNDFKEEMQLYEINNAITFPAKIQKISQYNGINTILVKGFEENTINYRGEVYFSIQNTTRLIWKDSEITVSDLDIGDTVLITFNGSVLETAPVGIKNVLQIQILDKED